MQKSKATTSWQFTPDDFLVPARPPVLKKGADGTALVYACALGHLEEVREAMKRVPPYHMLWDTALRKAAANGHTDVVRVMTDALRSTRNRGVRWESVLYAAAKCAAQHGHDDTLALLLQRGSPMVMIGSETPLQSAARAGQAKTANVLLAAGADPGSFDVKKTDTPMALARQQKSTGVAHALRKWAAAEAKTSWGTAVNPRHEQVRRAATQRLHSGRALDKDAMRMAAPKIFSPVPPPETVKTVQIDEGRDRGRIAMAESNARTRLQKDFEKTVPPPEFGDRDSIERASREFKQLRRRSTARRFSLARGTGSFRRGSSAASLRRSSIASSTATARGGGFSTAARAGTGTGTRVSMSFDGARSVEEVDMSSVAESDSATITGFVAFPPSPAPVPREGAGRVDGAAAAAAGESVLDSVSRPSTARSRRASVAASPLSQASPRTPRFAAKLVEEANGDVDADAHRHVSEPAPPATPCELPRPQRSVPAIHETGSREDLDSPVEVDP